MEYIKFFLILFFYWYLFRLLVIFLLIFLFCCCRLLNVVIEIMLLGFFIIMWSFLRFGFCLIVIKYIMVLVLVIFLVVVFSDGVLVFCFLEVKKNISFGISGFVCFKVFMVLNKVWFICFVLCMWIRLFIVLLNWFVVW